MNRVSYLSPVRISLPAPCLLPFHPVRYALSPSPSRPGPRALLARPSLRNRAPYGPPHSIRLPSGDE